LRFACENILIFFTFFEIIEIPSINVGEFWFPCLFFDEFPDVNINAGFACNNSFDIGNLACCDVGFDVLGNDEGGAVGKSSSDEENVKLHDLLFQRTGLNSVPDRSTTTEVCNSP
jgi:hypothetical protein